MTNSGTTTHAVLIVVAILLPVALWGRFIAPAKAELDELALQETELALRLDALQGQQIDANKLDAMATQLHVSREGLRSLREPLPGAAAFGEELDRIASSLGGRIVRFEPGNSLNSTDLVLESTKENVHLSQRDFRVEFECDLVQAPAFFTKLHAYPTWISIQGMRIQESATGSKLARISIDLELSAITFVPQEDVGAGS